METTAAALPFMPLSVKSLSSDVIAPTILRSSYTLNTKGLGDDGRPVSNHIDDIPIIDVSLLISDDPKEIRKLGRACEEWGFFLAINHGVSEGLMTRIQDACGDFFNMTEDEKEVYKGMDLSDSIYYEEYCEKARELAKQLVKGISESLGFEKTYIGEAMDMDQGYQLFVANLYPPCPDPENAIGLPAHTDNGLITLLMQNGIHGLQILHNGEWIQVKGIPGALFVNTCDQIEIFTNGKYKSVVHRAAVNGSIMRMSVVVSFGPSLDTFVGPSNRLLWRENSTAAYYGKKYEEYYDHTYKGQGKNSLESSKIMP